MICSIFLRWFFVVGFLLSVNNLCVRSFEDFDDMKLHFKHEPEDVELDENYRLFVNRSQDIINSTLTRDGHYRDITVTVIAFSETFILDLKLNTYLFATTYFQKSISSTGETYHNVNHTKDHCHYLGNVRGRNFSSAAVSTCNGIVGYFSVGNLSYHIEPQNGHINGLHRVYRSKEGAKTKYTCGSHGELPRFLPRNILQKHSRVRREFLWPQDGDKRAKVVELYVANDYNQYLIFSQDTTQIFDRTKVIVNIASALYQPLGIYLVLVGVEAWTSGNLIAIDRTDSLATLDNWYAYRRTNINPLHYNDAAVLITVWIFEGGVIGKAKLQSMCSFNSSGAIISDIQILPAQAGSTMAHEIGHTFGLIHDLDICPCDEPDGRHCIMYYQTDSSNPSTRWSQCSKDQLANAFQHGLDICLYDVPQTIFQANISTCGNGIQEDGEQCDCGNATSQVCNQTCCDRGTCQLVSPARCAAGRCCDVARCQLKPQWTECRTRNSECDLAEFCDGENSRCPADAFKPDGTDCTQLEAAYCYQGLCRGHRSQCELLWGPATAVSNYYCYRYSNTRGDLYGNCGMNWLQNPPGIPCSVSDVYCGRLQCDDITKLLYHYLVYFTLASSSIGPFPCHAAIFDFGLHTEDPGMVPNGAKCGDAKMCINQACVNVSDVLQSSCFPSCQLNEVCNNLKQCQKISPDPSTTTVPTTTTTTSTTTTTPTTTIPTTTTTTSTSTTTTPDTTTTTPTTTTTTTSTTTIPTTTTTTTPTTTSTTSTSTTTPTTITTTIPTTTSTTSTSTTTPTTTTTTTPTTTSTTSTSTTTTPTTTTSSTTTLPTTESTTTTSTTSTPSTTTLPTSTTTSTTTLPTTTSTTTTSTTTSTTTLPTTPTSTTSTTTATSLPTSTTTSTTTLPTTTKDEGEGEGACGIYLGSGQGGMIDTLRFDGSIANRFSRYSFSANSFRSRLILQSQYFYTEICAGVFGPTTAQLRTNGAYPPLSFDWMSTAQNGVDNGCRGGVLSVSSIITISMSQNGSGLYSSREQKETSWSLFSVTDTMKYDNQLLSVFGSRSSSVRGALPFFSPMVNPSSPVQLYNAATTVYTCDSEVSAYFFSMSVGVPAGSTANVQLVISGMDYAFEMTRQNNRTTGTTTLARTVLVPCTSEARMVLADGEVANGSNLITFTAFPYELKTGTSVAWAGYRTRDVTNPGTIAYDLWLVRKEINFQVENSVVQIPISGYYYIYVSGGVGQGKQMVLSVLVNDNIPLFGLTRTATDHNGIDTIGHGMVVLLSANDQLRVFAASTTISSRTGLHTSFLGILLYTEN